MEESVVFKLLPEWDKIEEAREKTEEFLEAKGCGLDDIDALIMITGELLENAVKYGDYVSAEDFIILSIIIDQGEIIIDVANPIQEDRNQYLIKLDKTIQWIRGFQNPFEAYIEKLKSISSQSLDSMESGLGLTRIAYEGQAVLDFFVSEENRVKVSAVYEH